ncbi:MAG: peptidylprolyl isomerase [Planctomycetes bacterium]|jgi:FKBP-type peptidyl-prolyl cis-trans isomerase SlyD|nr:peptidylprolyl isomerase [Planctomycetota bacterium]MDP6409396.1 peptidylprolyl isomerase [Planctomycetota bacterium]
MKIESGLLVELNYELLDAAGELVESSAHEEVGPLQYLHGLKEIPSALEQELEGRELGAALELTLAPEEAFGPYDAEALINVPRAEFPDGDAVEVGEWIQVTVEDEESDEGEDYEVHMRVVQLDDEAIVLDGNHPLAGQRVTYKVQVGDVRPPTAEELREREEDGGEGGD